MMTIKLFIAVCAEVSAVKAGRIHSCATYPKCCGVAPRNGAVRCTQPDASAPPTGKVRSDAQMWPSWVRTVRRVEVRRGGTGENIRRCSALESTPPPPEWCDQPSLLFSSLLSLTPLPSFSLSTHLHTFSPHRMWGKTPSLWLLNDFSLLSFPVSLSLSLSLGTNNQAIMASL